MSKQKSPTLPALYDDDDDLSPGDAAIYDQVAEMIAPYMLEFYRKKYPEVFKGLEDVQFI